MNYEWINEIQWINENAQKGNNFAKILPSASNLNETLSLMVKMSNE